MVKSGVDLNQAKGLEKVNQVDLFKLSAQILGLKILDADEAEKIAGGFAPSDPFGDDVDDNIPL